MSPSLHESDSQEQARVTGSIVFQPRSRLRKYSNKRLVHQDAIFLNEEATVKSNIVTENFYRIRETDNIVNNVDLVETKLVNVMRNIKKADRSRRQQMLKSGLLHCDSRDPSEVIRARRGIDVPASGRPVAQSDN